MYLCRVCPLLIFASETTVIIRKTARGCVSGLLKHTVGHFWVFEQINTTVAVYLDTFTPVHVEGERLSSDVTSVSIGFI